MDDLSLSFLFFMHIFSATKHELSFIMHACMNAKSKGMMKILIGLSCPAYESAY